MQPQVIDLASDSTDDDSVREESAVDPELWCNAVATALAFRGLTQAVRASKGERVRRSLAGQSAQEQERSSEPERGTGGPPGAHQEAARGLSLSLFLPPSPPPPLSLPLSLSPSLPPPPRLCFSVTVALSVFL